MLKRIIRALRAPRLMLVLLAPLIALLASCQSDYEDAAITADDLRGELLDFLASDFYAAKISAYRGEAEAMQTTAASYCTAVQATTAQAAQLEQLRSDWRDLMQAFAPMQFLRLGPWQDSLIGSRFLRTQFWPEQDKSFLFAQLDTLINGTDSLAEQDYRGYSIAVQGLSALEFTLFNFDNAGFLAEPRVCQMLQSSLAILIDVAIEVDDLWPAFAAELTQTPNGEFADNSEALQVLAEGLWSGTQLLKDRKLGDALGQGGLPVNTSSLEISLDPSNREMLRANYSFIREALLVERGYGSYLRLVNNGSLVDSIVDSVDENIAFIDSLAEDPLVVLADPAANSVDLGTLDALFLESTTLVGLIRNDLSAALGVTVGFNSSDGD